MNTFINFRKVFGLVALLCCGVWMANAQDNGLRVSGGNGNTAASPCYCMGSSGNFTLSYAGTDGFTIRANSIRWTKIGGGVEITAGSNDFTVTVNSQNGTDYSSDYSKFAKSRLKVVCVLEKEHTINVNCIGEEVDERSYYETREVSTEIDICKDFDYGDVGIVNPIVGPNCVALGDKVTYSIQPWVSQKDANKIGFDSYAWNLDTKKDYHSSDHSSITFTVDQDFLNHRTLTVTMGACNEGTTPVQRILTEKPKDPYLLGYSEWVDEICIPLNEKSKVLTIENKQEDPSITYTWEMLSGWYPDNTYPLPSGEKSITLNVGDNDKYIRLKVESDCETKIYDLQIKRSFSSSINSIVAKTYSDACLPQETPIIFEVNGASTGIPRGWSIVSGADNGWRIADGDENSPLPTITTGTGEGKISVTTEGCDGEEPIQATFQVIPEQPTITGSLVSNGQICINAATGSTPAESITLNVAPDDNATDGYEWEFPAEWTPSEGSRITPTPTITITTDGKTSGQVRVRAIGCEPGEWSTSVNVGFNPVKPEIEQEGCLDAGLPGVTYFKVAKHLSGQTYTWNIDSRFGEQDMTYSDSADPSKIRVITLGNVGNDFEITVHASNTCGDSPESEVYTAEVVNIFAAYNETSGLGLGMLRVLSIDGDLPFDADYSSIHIAWYLNGEPTPYQEGFALFGISFPNREKPEGYAEAIITYNGCRYKVETSWDNNSLRSAKSFSLESIEEETSPVTADMIIAPNPARDRITVSLPEISNGSVLLLSLDGKLLKRVPANSLNVELNVSDIPDGTYIISAAQNGKRCSKQVIIKK